MSCMGRGKLFHEGKGALEAGCGTDDKDEGHAGAQEEATNHISRVMLVVHHARAGYGP